MVTYNRVWRSSDKEISKIEVLVTALVSLGRDFVNVDIDGSSARSRVKLEVLKTTLLLSLTERSVCRVMLIIPAMPSIVTND